MESEPAHRTDLEPWRPGQRGKFVVHVDGALSAWKTDLGGAPHHAYAVAQLKQPSVIEGDIDQDGALNVLAAGRVPHLERIKATASRSAIELGLRPPANWTVAAPEEQTWRFG